MAELRGSTREALKTVATSTLTSALLVIDSRGDPRAASAGSLLGSPIAASLARPGEVRQGIRAGATAGAALRTRFQQPRRIALFRVCLGVRLK